jgi:hypothetical protein
MLLSGSSSTKDTQNVRPVDTIPEKENEGGGEFNYDIL